MDALIIAAGFGSRLRDISDSKPMTPIAGIPLLELGVRQAKAAGVSRVVVVTGHEADRLEAGLPALSLRAGIPVVAQRVEDWTKPNGWSVLAGADIIPGDYLLMMSDHIFSGSILTRLARQGTTKATRRSTSHRSLASGSNQRERTTSKPVLTA